MQHCWLRISPSVRAALLAALEIIKARGSIAGKRTLEQLLGIEEKGEDNDEESDEEMDEEIEDSD